MVVMMRILTPKNFKKVADKILAKKQRWNDTLDKALCDSVLTNVHNPVFTQGIPVHNRIVTVNNITCRLIVIYNPYMVISRGWAIAGCMTDTINQIVIFVDDDYMHMTKDTQEFTIHHELGHIVCNHSTRLYMRHIDQEYEADTYASTYSSHGIEALQEIANYVCRKAKKEINLRINHLRKGVMQMGAYQLYVADTYAVITYFIKGNMYQYRITAK